MIALNLIPKEQKIALRNTRLYEAIKESLTLLFLFATIIATLLWVSRYYLEKELVDLAIANATFIASNASTDKKISELNARIQTISNVQANFISNRRLLEDLSLLAPTNVAYQEIHVYRQQNLVELTGSARTRNDLVDFKNQLSIINWIKSVDLPMASLIDKENNDFIIRLELNPTKLPQL